MQSEGSSECRKIVETASIEATNTHLVTASSEKRKLEEALSTRNAWGTRPTVSIADGEIDLPTRPADTGAYTQPATPSIDSYQSLDVDTRDVVTEINTEAGGSWDAANHYEPSTPIHVSCCFY